MYVSISNKVVKIINETIGNNESHVLTLSYTRNNLVKLFAIFTLFTIQEIGMHVKY